MGRFGTSVPERTETLAVPAPLEVVDQRLVPTSAGLRYRHAAVLFLVALTAGSVAVQIDVAAAENGMALMRALRLWALGREAEGGAPMLTPEAVRSLPLAALFLLTGDCSLLVADRDDEGVAGHRPLVPPGARFALGAGGRYRQLPGIDDEALTRLHRHRAAVRLLAEPGGDSQRRITHEHLVAVRDLYREAVRLGVTPGRHIATQLGILESTAVNHIGEARQRNVLGPAIRPGVAGERFRPEDEDDG